MNALKSVAKAKAGTCNLPVRTRGPSDISTDSIVFVYEKDMWTKDKHKNVCAYVGACTWR